MKSRRNERVQIKKPDVLGGFYRIMVIFLVLGFSVGIVVTGLQSGLSFAAGVFTVVLPFVLWQLKVDYGLTPGQKPPWWFYPLIFLRYALLAIVFYAIIRLLQMQWIWFVFGTMTVVPGLLIAAFLFRNLRGHG